MGQVKLPIIGQVSWGQTSDSIPAVPKKSKAVLGTWFDLGIKPLSGEKSVSEKLIQSFYGWVYVNVSVIAEEVSKMELKLYQSNFRGGELVLDEIQEHPALDGLDRFNESTAAGDAFYLTSAHQELAGDAFWYIDGTEADIRNIFLLQPDHIELNLGDYSKSAARLIEGYTYKVTIDGKTQEKKYSPNEIIQFKDPNPANPYRGKSAVEAAARWIDTDNLSIEASRKFYENGMIANFALSSDQRLTPDQIKGFEAELRRSRTGFRNAFRVPIFGGGLKAMPLQMSAKEVELIKQQEWLRDTIMASFKNTKASLGIVEDVNRANAEASLAGWKRSVIKPKMKRIVDNLNEFYLPRFGENLILGFEDPVPEDRVALIKEVVDIYGNAQKPLVTLNEARDILGYDAVQEEGADDVKQPMPDFTPLPDPVKNVNFVRHFRRNKRYSELKAYQEIYKASQRAATKLITSRKKAKLSRPKLNRFHKRLINIVEQVELVFGQKVIKYINTLIEESQASLEDEQARRSGELFDREAKLMEAQASFGPVLMQAMVQAGHEANRLLGIDKPYMPKGFKDLDGESFIRQQIELFATSLLDTDKDKMAAIIAQGLEKGDSIPQIRRAIQDVFSEYSKTQAERITRTEVMRAANAAVNDSYRESGVVTGEQWLTAPGACAYCEPLNGKLVKLDENFFNKGDEWLGNADSPLKLDYEAVGGPPLHVNCRCTTIPVIVDTEPLLKPKALNQDVAKRIHELEDHIDKRTKSYRDLQKERQDDLDYISELEGLLGVDNDR